MSIHPQEEIFCGKAHVIAKKTVEKTLTIIIPRHIDKIEEMYANLKDLGLKIQIKNEKDDIQEFVDIVLVNYYGSVNKYLREIDQIFVGKSSLKKFEGEGGQNPIDAIKTGCHIYHGPYVSNFNDIYQFLDETELSEKTENYEILAKKLIVNFNKNFKQDSDKINKINSYSDEIFNNVVLEFNKLIK